MVTRRAVFAIALAVPFAGACQVRGEGFGQVPVNASRGGDDAAPPEGGPPDAPAAPEDAPGVDAAADLATAEAVGSPDVPADAAAPPDLPLPCLPPMKMCGDQCLGAACCDDSDCTAGGPGELGQCDEVTHACQYTCVAGTRPCNGACIPQSGCCSPDSCPGSFACLQNVCSSSECRTGYKLCGAACITASACCRADGCCAHADCGPCQKCVAGQCQDQSASEDLKDECRSGHCQTGTCDGHGACGLLADGQNDSSCSGECQSCQAGACRARQGVCSTGQMCTDGQCPPRPPVAVRVNVNGPQYGLFSADPGVGGVCSPSAYGVAGPINGTDDDPLYTGEMFGAPLVCKVGGGTLPAGMYHVNLDFAEIYWGPTCAGGGAGVGSRVFDIAIEGNVVATNVDLFREAGCAASTDGSGHPVVKSFLVSVTDGTLDLRLDAHVDNAKISAIEILSAW